MKQSSSARSPFLSYPYAAVAERTFGRVHVAKLLWQGKIAGFFPFQYRSLAHQRLGWGERVSGDLADGFGLVAEPELRLTATQLMRISGLTGLCFTHLPESQTQHGLSGEQPETGLLIEFPDGGNAYWNERKRLDSKFTADTERRERKLVEAFGPLNFVFRHEDPRPALEHLIAAKRAQYARTDADDSLGSRLGRDFLYALSAGTDTDCLPVLSTLHAGETWVASHFGLLCDSTLHYWFPVYNPEMRSFAAGRLLIRAIIRESDNFGVRAIDRGSGDSAAKRDFANSTRLYLRGVWSLPSPAGFAYRAGLSASWRLKLAAQRLTEIPERISGWRGATPRPMK